MSRVSAGLGIEEAQILSQALGTVSATYLLCLDDEGFLSGQEQDLLRWFRGTDDRGRETILKLAGLQSGAANGQRQGAFIRNYVATAHDPAWPGRKHAASP